MVGIVVVVGFVIGVRLEVDLEDLLEVQVAVEVVFGRGPPCCARRAENERPGGPPRRRGRQTGRPREPERRTSLPPSSRTHCLTVAHGMVSWSGCPPSATRAETGIEVINKPVRIKEAPRSAMRIMGRTYIMHQGLSCHGWIVHAHPPCKQNTMHQNVFRLSLLLGLIAWLTPASAQLEGNTNDNPSATLRRAAHAQQHA